MCRCKYKLSDKHVCIKQILDQYHTVEDAVLAHIKREIEPNVTNIVHISSHSDREELLVTYEYMMQGYNDYTGDCVILTEHLDWE